MSSPSGTGGEHATVSAWSLHWGQRHHDERDPHHHWRAPQPEARPSIMGNRRARDTHHSLGTIRSGTLAQ